MLGDGVRELCARCDLKLVERFHLYRFIRCWVMRSESCEPVVNKSWLMSFFCVGV
jgi:hypothetical protein